MFGKLKRLFVGYAETVEEWSERLAPTTSPDRLIAAAIVESFAKEGDKWTHHSHLLVPQDWRWAGNHKSCVFKMGHKSRKGLEVEITITVRSRDNDGASPWLPETFEVSVKGVPLSEEVSVWLVKEFRRLETAHQKALEAAAAAKAEMERNEKLWNIAENMLNMKRLPSGALVPIEEFNFQSEVARCSTCQLVNAYCEEHSV
jgi:hypothetical protein